MSEKDTTLWKDYVHSLSRQLAVLGDQAAALGHPSLTGDARELAVRDFFERIVPESVGITGGRVFDRTGAKSAEIDAILYDKNFPLVRIGLDCLVPVDAAVALFEVKSELDSDAVRDALRKCRSVSDLRKRVYRLNKIGAVDLPFGDLTVEELDKASPGFYVYGFKGFSASVDPLRAVMADWIQGQGSIRSAVPRVIATPTCLGIRKRDAIKISSDAGAGDILFAATVTPAGANVLVADLLEKIARRVTYLTQDLMCRTMGDYFDPNWYLEEYVTPTTSDWRNIQTATTPPGW